MRQKTRQCGKAEG